MHYQDNGDCFKSIRSLNQALSFEATEADVEQLLGISAASASRRIRNLVTSKQLRQIGKARKIRYIVYDAGYHRAAGSTHGPPLFILAFLRLLLLDFDANDQPMLTVSSRVLWK